MDTDGQKNIHPTCCSNTGILRSFRDAAPSHYTLKVNYFPLLLSSVTEKHESRVFEASGYKWKLCLYPKGNHKKGVMNHVSLYLELANADTLPPGWEINVQFKLFVYDHIRDKYLTLQDNIGETTRFHSMKTVRGFDELLPLDTLTDKSNGYLLDHACVFGAEVFVIRGNGMSECLSTMENNHCYSWEIDYSFRTSEYIDSGEFTVGDHKWKLRCYPLGDTDWKGEKLSLFLELVNSKTLPEGRKVYAEYILRIKDQVHTDHHERKDSYVWSSKAEHSLYGFPDFISLDDLRCHRKSYIPNDKMIVEAQIKLISDTKGF